MKCDVVFRINYLLGVSEEDLKRDFSELYKESNNLKYFENYCDAKTLRCLNILRQSLIHNFNVYQQDKKSKILSDNKSVIDYLKSKNIDISKVVNTYELFDIFNILTEMVNVILYKVLVDLEIPYIDELQEYLYFPELENMKMLNDLYFEYKEQVYPYNIFIFEGKNIKQSLKYALHSDRNCIFSIYSILNLRFTETNLDFSLSFRKTKGEELDVNAVIDYENILSLYNDKKKEKESQNIRKEQEVKKIDKTVKSNTENEIEVTEVKKDTSSQKNTIDSVNSVETLKNNDSTVIESIKYTIPTIMNKKIVNSNIVKFKNNKSFSIFVDCRSLDFFKFINFLDSIDISNILDMTFILDDSTNRIWYVFDKIFNKNIKIKRIFVSKLESSNDVLNIAITKEICESVFMNQVSNVFILSNDSNIYNIMTLLNNVHFGVGYSLNKLNSNNIEFLSMRCDCFVDLETIVVDERIEKYLNDSMIYLILSVLASIPLGKWSIDNVSYKVYESLQDFSSISIKISDIKNIVEKSYNKISMKVIDNKVKLFMDSYSIEA